ncbi:MULTISPECIES: tail fiber domain-containing protein [Halomicrobium]|uniref:Peptidase S74 domain-containing protein n=2 Tax=Halomicrobium mukohataei TaxID=57705 RepID=C7NYH3_HALMD|nr:MULTISPECIES: tail fiber domain-containing protein [Halomicrobium]ACV46634.1 conserved hypothetical protein [Halomicrobium mukohataei DSM 12286]QCD65144.1 hypothetical protein E5139_05620 [Halomicrobium mukohataei]QFR19950.1 hypothetical protein GBQ70_05615 [Halomicrobium sp. ZPS1]
MTTDDLRRRVERLEAMVAAADDGPEGEDGLTRRTVLKGLGLAGVGSYAVGKARADPQGQLGTDTDPVATVYAQQLHGGLTGNTAVSSLLGPGLGIDSGSLSADVSGATSTGSGTDIYTGTTDGDLQFRSLVGGTNVSLSSASGAVTIDATAGSSVWSDPDADDLLEPTSSYRGIDLSGVSNPRVVTPWIGTTTATAFEAFVGTTRVARFTPTGTDGNAETAAGNVLLGQYAQIGDGATGVAVGGGGSPTNSHENVAYDNYGTISGGQNNTVGSDDGDPVTAAHATIGGGYSNTASSVYATIAGGTANTASAKSVAVGGGNGNTSSGNYAAVAGGYSNSARSRYGTIGGGSTNTASGQHATVGGGNSNTAGGDQSTVGGGQNNSATGPDAAVPGGQSNTAAGSHSLAAGRRAAANDAGAFVWADSQDADFASDADYNGSGVTGNDTFHVRAQNGARIVNGAGTTYIPSGSTGWTATSTRAAKTNFQPIDPDSVLDGVRSLDVATWEYKTRDGEAAGVEHMGPTAEAFDDAFGLGESQRHINSINADGVALAAIQGLADRADELAAELERKDERVGELEDRLAERDERVDELAAELERKDERIDELESRLDDLETLVQQGE